MDDSNFEGQYIYKKSTGKQTLPHSKIVKGDLTYELLGTLDPKDQRELEAQYPLAAKHGLLPSGKVVLGKGNFGKIRLARRQAKQPDSLEETSEIVAFKKQHYRNKAIAEFKNGVGIAPHPNVVRTLDILITQDKIPYIALEYFPSHDGDEEQKRMRDRLKDPEDAAAAREELKPKSAQMLDGLIHVQDQGNPGHDVKPGNFLFGVGGTVKLCDFGIVDYDQESVESKLGMTLLHLSGEDPQKKTFRVFDRNGAALDLKASELALARDGIDPNRLGDGFDGVVAALVIGRPLKEVRAFPYYATPPR